jgi:hypothetical protein
MATGVVARALALLLHPPLGIDEARYLVTAHHLRSGMGYADWHGPEIDILPLHPLLTAGLGADPGTLEWRGRLVAFVASILILAALAALTLKVAGRKEVVIAVTIASLDPWLLPTAARPQPESLYALLILTAFLVIARVRPDGAAPGWWALAGVLLGCAYLARPEGFLVAFVVGFLFAWRAAKTRLALPGVLFYAGAFLVTVLPYMVWLRGAAGRWMITGKSDEIFFIGQAMHDSGGEPPTAEAYLSLQRRYGDWITFVREDPAAFCGRLLRLGRRIFGWILPRTLGPLGIIGWCSLLVLRKAHGYGRAAPLWTAVPALVFPLMMLTFPNERVAGAALPFLLLPAAVGLRRAYDGMRRFVPARSVVALGIVLLGISWLPAALRPGLGGELGAREIEKEFAARGLALTSDERAIATNSPVVSFYLRDPDMFGVPGLYRPLEPGLSCSDLVAEMRRRGAVVSVIDDWSGGASAPANGKDCPLERVGHFADQAMGRRTAIVRLAP